VGIAVGTAVGIAEGMGVGRFEGAALGLAVGLAERTHSGGDDNMFSENKTDHTRDASFQLNTKVELYVPKN
jgi:hypothetical protein